MDMMFFDRAHKRFYDQMLEVERAQRDVYRQALFYTLGLSTETREHIKDLYDFNQHQVMLSGLRRPWQTGDSSRVTRLAFNLYCGYVGHDGTPVEDFTPHSLFDVDLLPFMLEAIKVRFPRNAQSQ